MLIIQLFDKLLSILRVLINLLRCNIFEIDRHNKVKRHYCHKQSPTHYIVPLCEPTHIIDNIYLGSAFNAASRYTINKLSIKLIINVTKNINNYFNDLTYVNIPIHDNGIDLIDNYLQKTYDNIASFQIANSGNILIHCFFGASRSVSVVLFYLIKKHNMSLKKAIKFVSKKRKVIHPSLTLLKSIQSITNTNS